VTNPEAGKEKVAMTSPVQIDMPVPSAAAASSGPSESIAMTSPVQITMPSPSSAAAGGDAGNNSSSNKAKGPFSLSFVMPSKYTLATLPRPNNDKVQLKEVPGKTLAVVSFSGGSPRETLVEEKRGQLLDLLKGSGYRPAPGAEGRVNVYQYHPPFMPGFLRLNEVLLEVVPEAEGK
jgi:hypothetical protein